jgi:hypothetical protein
MASNRYRTLPVNPERFFVVALPRAFKRSWLKVDDTGQVLATSPGLAWATGLAIEKVEAWCRSKQLPIRSMHGNIKDIRPYL